MARVIKFGKTKMNYALEQRIRFIDFCLLEYGFVTTDKVARYFGIGERTARDDLKLYQAIAPNNMQKEHGVGWVAAKSFSAVFVY